VHPTVIGDGPQAEPVGPGRTVTPVSHEYAKAFLKAVLPQMADFVKQIGVPVKKPIVLNDVDMTKYLAKYNCGIVEDDPRIFVDMKDGSHFYYSHGRALAFYAADAMSLPDKQSVYTYPEIDQEQARYFGPINMTTNEALALVRQAVKKLGCSEKVPHIDEPPRFLSGPGWWGANRIARCSIDWRESTHGSWGEVIDGPTWVNAEVDMANKTIRVLYINDYANTNIWRKPPEIGIPLKTPPPEDEPLGSPLPESSVVEGQPPIKPPVSLPSGTPLPGH
jgi:hypothetical protein